MQKFSFLLLFWLLFLGVSYAQQPSIFEINKSLGKGINMGNMFEAPSETEWGNPFRDDYFKRISDLGFNHVRIPIRWDVTSRALQSFPYTINNAFFDRIKYVIDKALAEKLYVIINMHHHEGIFQDPDGNKAEFISQWAQIANYFKGYDHRLVFEVMNEPNTGLNATKWNSFFKDALMEIRKTNPLRAVLMGTSPWGGLAGVPDLDIPNDENIIITVHYYDPFTFTHQGAEWVSGADAWLGTIWDNTNLERNEIISSFNFLKSFAKSKNKPVHIGEFGAYNKANLASRLKWSNFLARWFESQEFSWTYWEWSAGFGIFNPSTNQYQTDLANALLKDPMSAPKTQTTIPVYEGAFGNADGWNLQVQSPALASINRSGGVASIDINQAGTEGWHIQFVRAPIAMKKDSRYLVSIKASADKPVSITNYIGKNGDPWNSYSGYKSISLNTTSEDYIYSFVMTSNTDNLSRMVFDMGSKAAKISIASVKIEEVKDVVSANHNLELESFKISPNPASEYFIISGIDKYKYLKIYDLQGKLVQETSQSGFRKISIDALAAGKYIVEILNEKGRGVKILMKE